MYQQKPKFLNEAGTCYSKRGYHLAVLASLLASFVSSGCKPRNRNVSEALGSNDSGGKLVRTEEQANFYRPINLPEQPLISIEQLKRMATLEGGKLDSLNLSTLMLPSGELVLIAKTQNEVIPFASGDGKDFYIWDQYTTAELRGNSPVFKPSNFFVRHLPDKEPEDPENAIYSLLRRKGGELDLVPLTANVVSSSGLFSISGNRFYDEDAKLKFQYIEIGKDFWQFDGEYSNGYICSGSILWKKTGTEDIVFSATKEYGRVRVLQWNISNSESGLMQLDGEIVGTTLDSVKANTLKACPGKTEELANDLLKSLDYFPETKVSETQNAKPLVYGTDYPLGSRVRIDATSYIVLATLIEWNYERAEAFGESLPEEFRATYVYILTNDQKTYSEDRGKPVTRVYEFRSAELKEIGKVGEFILAAAHTIEKLNEQRIASREGIAEAQERARWYLALAEVKAKQVDSKRKLLAAAVSVVAFDACFRGFSKAGTLKVLGLKLPPGVNSSATLAAISVGKEGGTVAQALLASFYMTLIQGAALSSDIVMNHPGSFDLDLLKKVLTTTGQTGLVLGLRSAFPRGPLLWFGASLSGLTMRWRKISIDTALGFDNGGTIQQLANMTVGALSAVAQVYFVQKGPGFVGAIGGVGMLLGDIISGRGTPGVILGSALEIVTNLNIKHPLYRAVLIPTARTISALLVLMDAQHFIDRASDTLTQARELRRHQVALRDAILWLTRANDEALAKFSSAEKDFVLTTVAHPFEVLVQSYHSL